MPVKYSRSGQATFLVQWCSRAHSALVWSSSTIWPHTGQGAMGESNMAHLMKIATWNVNSLKVRLPHVLDWLAATQADVLCLQETKTEDKGFPYAELETAGYHAVHNGQKTYNGVAILARAAPKTCASTSPAFADEQKRVMRRPWNGVRIVCAYMPNGQAVGSDKYEYKLRWLAALGRPCARRVAALAAAGAAGRLQHRAGGSRRA
jgi:exonuclease III